MYYRRDSVTVHIPASSVSADAPTGGNTSVWPALVTVLIIVIIVVICVAVYRSRSNAISEDITPDVEQSIASSNLVLEMTYLESEGGEDITFELDSCVDDCI